VAAETELLIGTRKGLFVLRGPRGGPAEIKTRAFAGEAVEYAMHDPRTDTYFASVTHGQFGPHLFFTRDPAGDWEQASGPAFPDGMDAAVKRIWIVEPGEEPGVLWAGVDPAALYRSEDEGRTWTLNRALWDQPSRPQWQGGAGGLCLHTICTWPGDAKRLIVGISAAGVWLSDDAGESWRRGNRGLVALYVPEPARSETQDFCIHKIQRCTRQPSRLFMQFHGGVYRSDDGGESWKDIANGLPSGFGFPIATHPRDPNRAFVIPLTADLDRVTPEGSVRVFGTSDAGASWEALDRGLPQDDAYLTVLRQAFCHDGQDPLGLYFGSESGEVFGSSDEGRTWRQLAARLPPVLAVQTGH
jgi:photosystem II stability/assembly factor-like uncharacterized protein